MRMDQIEQVAKVMRDFDLTEFEMESDDIKLTLRRGSNLAAPVQMVSHAPAAMQSAAAPPVTAEPQDDGSANAVTVDSPIVGTFYSSPAPDAEAYVKVGDEVSEDTVVCIIEAMKVMNEIKAEKRGKIKKILIENATPVEYGQALFEIEPA